MEDHTDAGMLEFAFIDADDPRMHFARSLRFLALYDPYGVEDGDPWDYLPPETRHIIAQSDELIVGYACMIPEGEWAHIRQVAVEVGYRRQGIATALIRELLRAASEEGRRWAYLNARLDAIRLYDRLGFAHVGPVFRTAITNLPHVRMEREL